MKHVKCSPLSDARICFSTREPWGEVLSSTRPREYFGRTDSARMPRTLSYRAQSPVSTIKIRKFFLFLGHQSPANLRMYLNFPFSYQSITASAYGSSTLRVAVPSRLYFTPSEHLPLAGVRLSVKDLFHLKGVPTTHGNRAYARLYGEKQVTSAAVQDAINKGAIIVGKTKTAEFAGSQEVEGDWADYSCPFNPRADGYLRSTGSSTGSASGVASYSWLDGSLGSDGVFSGFFPKKIMAC